MVEACGNSASNGCATTQEFVLCGRRQGNVAEATGCHTRGGEGDGGVEEGTQTVE